MASRTPDPADLFHELNALDGPAREARLAEITDESLRDQLRSMLDHQSDTADFLDAPPAFAKTGLTFEGVVPELHHENVLDTGAVLGDFTIVRRIGAGGMGAVYQARQSKPSRDVALKIMQAGYVSREALSRFALEAEVLGRLKHPGIAQIYHAGVHEKTPFFAMELIEGATLTKYAADKKLTLRQRVELFKRICDAVHHAHMNGVVHRDLKPANILVTDVGPAMVAQPKVLDFGIARNTDADMRTATLATDVGQIIGTLSYMSPEQIAGDPTRIDFRSDVYTLGVVLYELLCGEMPYDVSNAMLHQAARAITEDPPTKLASRSPQFRGDVDTIVSKALEKDPARRYQSAAELGEDLTRYLRHQPISARPPSAAYELKKFAKRNRVLVGGAAATVAALVLGFFGVLWQLGQTTQARDEARENLALAEQREREVDQVAGFQADMFTGLDAQAIGAGILDEIREQGGDTTASLIADVNAPDLARTILDEFILAQASTAAGEQFADQPRVESRLRDTLARTYNSLGLRGRAVEEMELRRSLLIEEYGEDDLRTVAATRDLGFIYAVAARYDEADKLLASALDARTAQLGPNDPETLMVVQNRLDVASLRGDFATAAENAQRLLDYRLSQAAEPDDATLSLMTLVASNLRELRRDEEALPLYQRAYDIRLAQDGPDVEGTRIAAHNLGAVLEELGRLDEAEALLVPVLEARVATLGEDHPYTAISKNAVSKLYVKRGRLEEAEVLSRKAVDTFVTRTSATNPGTATLTGRLAKVLAAKGDQRGAADLFMQQYEIRRTSSQLGPRHPHTLEAATNLAETLGELGDYREAIAVLAKAVEDAGPGAEPLRARDAADRLAKLSMSWSAEAPNSDEAREAVRRWATPTSERG